MTAEERAADAVTECSRRHSDGGGEWYGLCDRCITAAIRAAEDEALERAAVIVESVQTRYLWGNAKYPETALSEAADVIRALKTPPAAPPSDGKGEP